MFVGQVDRQAVDLRFAHERERCVDSQAEEPARAGAEFGEFLRVHRVVEREHRHAVADLGEAAFRCAADAVGGRVGADQLREACLDRGVAPAQRIVLRVGDLRCVLLVVQTIVMRDLARQCREFGGGFRLGKRPRLWL